MAYASITGFRAISHYETADILDSEVSSLIPIADLWVTKNITIEHYNERLSGDIDGDNTVYTTKYKPIADVNYDSSVDADDVNVYLVDYDSEMNEVSTSVSVSEVNSRDGIITLSTAPTTTNAEVGVYCDYSSYIGSVMDYDIIKEISNYYLAFLVARKKEAEYLDRPNPIGTGAKTMRTISLEYYKNAIRLLDSLVTKPKLRLVV